MTPFVQPFLAARDQYIELALYQDIIRHMTMGETVAPLIISCRARRVLLGPIQDILPTEGDVQVYLNRTSTQLSPEGPVTDLVTLAGMVERRGGGTVQLRSKSIKGESMRMHFPVDDILFFSTPAQLLGVKEFADSIDAAQGIVFEVEGIVDPKRAKVATAPVLYIPAGNVAWIAERIGLTIVEDKKTA